MSSTKLSPLPTWFSINKHNQPTVQIHAQPGAKRTAVVGLYGDKLKIALNSPPVDGKANSTLIKFLAKELKLSKSNIHLISGDTCREKRLAFDKITDEELLNAFEKLLS